MKRTITIVACFSVLIVLLYGVFSLAIFKTSAKYTDYKELNHFFESKELYISSNSLSSQNDKYNIINYYNFTPIEIIISNSINEEITNYDIKYEIECKILNNENEEYRCILDNTESNKITSNLIINKECKENKDLTEEECIQENYNYNLVKTINNHNFKITNDNGTKKTLEVDLILNTIKPYSKTLKAKYILNIGDNKDNQITTTKTIDHDTFCEYHINNNYNTEKKLKLTINTNKLLVDTTSDIYNKKIDYTSDINNQINTITFKIQTNERLILYKKDFTSKCTSSDITYIIIE